MVNLKLETPNLKNIPPILQVGDVLISSDLLTEQFCCDLATCHGACCVEGDAGAPVTLDEVMQIEEALDVVWPQLSASAQAVIDRQGVAYTDQEGDLVTSIVGGRDCVFTYYDALHLPTSQPPELLNSRTPELPDSRTPELPDSRTPELPNSRTPEIHNCCLCALERAYRDGRTHFCKPISCALYPIREKQFSDGTVALNYHRWEVCRCGRELGQKLQMPVYRFLREPLIRRFGEDWYTELCDVAQELDRCKD